MSTALNETKQLTESTAVTITC